MTHVEYLENLLKEYRKKIEENTEPEQIAFWQGACFGLAIAIRNLKEGGEKNA